MFKTIFSATTVALALFLSTAMGSVDPSQVQGGADCTGATNDNFCDGILCLYFYSEWVEADEGERSAIQGGTAWACVNYTFCGQNSYIVPSISCSPD